MSDVFTDPFKFAETFLYIIDKKNKKIKLRYRHIQRDYLSKRGHRDIVLKPRQPGISTAIQSYQFYLATTRTVSTATLAHDDATTQRLRRMSDRFYDNLKYSIAEYQGVDLTALTEDEAKEWTLINVPQRKYANSRVTTFLDFDSEAIIATAGNAATGRGGTYSHVHGSEVAYWKDADQIMAGLMQGGNPDIVLESTPNGAQGYFYNICKETLDGNNDWNLFFYTWWQNEEYKLPLTDDEKAEFSFSGDEIYGAMSELELVSLHPELSPEQINWRRKKQTELKHLFIQEYPEDIHSCFLTSGSGYFGSLTGVFSLLPGYVEPDPAHKYFAGLDFGQSNDYTVLIIIDATTMKQVDMIRLRRLPWAEMRKRIVNAAKKWQLVAIEAEKNSMGTTNIEALQTELSKAGMKTRLVQFQTTNNSKSHIMSQLHAGLNEDGLKLLNVPDMKNEFNSFVSKQLPSGLWQLAASGSEHDDTVIAAALAYDCALNMSRTIRIV